MRIAYVVLHLDSQAMRGGVGTKILTQVRLWGESGHEVQCFLLAREEMTLPHVRVYAFNGNVGHPFGFLLREILRSRALHKMISDIRKYQPDIIYLRYGLFTVPLQNLFKISPVVVEINTNDVDEYRYRGLFFYLMNLLTRGLILGSASGFISVSGEVIGLPQNVIFRKPMRVIGNGVDLEQYPQLPAPSNTIPVLVMMASPGLNWHGIDKLLDLALQCPDLRITIIGYSPGDLGFPVPANVELLGFMEHSYIRSHLARADVAFGTLALHRKNMQGTSALKVNEALACGLPLILAYEDTNLSGLDCDYILRLPNTENNVKENVRQIRDFAYQMIGKRVDRDLVRHRIDQREKEKERLEFFSAILQSNPR
jgi:glycosyltransferase involved in cell wall biosynthesis